MAPTLGYAGWLRGVIRHTESEMKRYSVRSTQPCPVCNGHLWHAMRERELTQNNFVCLIDIDAVSPVIDFTGTGEDFDECAKCGTVVV